MALEIDVTNMQLVSTQGKDIVVMRPKNRMTKAEALTHAAWLVALADEDDSFTDYLEAVLGT